jgi:hypothetical protein
MGNRKSWASCRNALKMGKRGMKLKMEKNKALKAKSQPLKVRFRHTCPPVGHSCAFDGIGRRAEYT